ncbi:hypothetical protein C2845_PM09G03650 [Panicum miliaceum]|uniref:DUF569 domain-containing protein n=1 Tax=Panicum miliaceum TaxID=4540 RepID=A0A3L6S2F7_PANMI|nr:hypothetical protein C2845_PM09G03650 [Panicum miliaceum]
MEFFGDGAHVRLRNRMHGAYLHADEDGAHVSLSPRRASLNTAWRVHRAAYDDPEQGDVLWEAVRVGDEAGDDVLMLHASNRLLRAAPWNPVLRPPVYVDMDNAGTMMHWVVDPIPLRKAPPVLPGPTELPRGVVLRRTIIYMRANNEGKFDPLDRRTYAFSGRSLFHLTGDLANQLRENFRRITLCVRAGSQGRLTPLVIDLPADEQPMEIVVFTSGSQGESLAVVSVAIAEHVICLCPHERCSVDHTDDN